MKMDKRLNRKIWATAKEYGIDRDMLHDIIFSELKKKSVTELTDSEARSLILRMRGKLKQCDSITPNQIEYLNRLLDTKFPQNPQRRTGWLKKFCNTNDIDSMTKKEATRCITLLKKM